MGTRVLRGSSAGFTLLEVVLALSIFALMGTILYGAFSLSHSAVEKSQASSERNQTLRAFIDLTGNYIRSSHPYRPVPDDPSIFFDGQENRLTFVSSFSMAMGGRGMSKIHIGWEEARDGPAVVKLEEEVPVRFNEESAGGHRNEVVLQEGIENFRLAYLDRVGEDEQWEERWDGYDKRALPRAVRLSYRDRNGREVRWVFPIMITVLTPQGR